MDIDKKIKEIEKNFRDGKVDKRIGVILGSFNTFGEWMIENFELEKYYDVDVEDLDEDEFQNNIKKLEKVIFEECVKRLRKEMDIEDEGIGRVLDNIESNIRSKRIKEGIRRSKLKKK